jgi:hypothetical protein
MLSEQAIVILVTIRAIAIVAIIVDLVRPFRGRWRAAVERRG